MNTNATNSGLPRRKRRCPICGRAPIQPWQPFCSKRCADVDLGRWFGESYRIPGADADALEPETDDREEPDGAGQSLDRLNRDLL